MAIASVTIDGGVLALPSNGGTTEDAHNYVDTLLDWSLLLNESWVSIYMSERVSGNLFANDLFPLRDPLKRLFAAHGITQYDVNTVAKVVERLLERTPSFEGYFHVRDVLADNILMEPNILQFCSSTALQSDLERCIILIAILRQHCHAAINNHSLILRKALNKIVKVRAHILDLEHNRSDLGIIPCPPEYFEGEVLICDDFKGLIKCLDETDILLHAADEDEIKTAIKIAIYKSSLERGSDPDWNDMQSPKIGRSFHSSLISNCSTKPLAIKLLRTIIETVEHINMKATHAIRTGAGGDNPQRVRESDQAKAWRRNIDGDHHLHYWVSTNNTVEIASISFPHNDYIIPE